MTPPNAVLAGRPIRLRTALVDVVGAWIVYNAVEIIAGSVRGVPYPDPAPVAPFLITYALYVALCASLLDRNTVGEKLHSIVPVSAHGKRLALWQWMARIALLSSFWGGWILLFDTSTRGMDRSMIFLSASLLGVVVFYGFLDLGMLFVRRTPRSLTDRVLRLAVVHRPPLQPHRAPAGPMYSATDQELGLPPKHKGK